MPEPVKAELTTNKFRSLLCNVNVTVTCLEFGLLSHMRDDPQNTAAPRAKLSSLTENG